MARTVFVGDVVKFIMDSKMCHGRVVVIDTWHDVVDELRTGVAARAFSDVCEKAVGAEYQKDWFEATVEYRGKEYVLGMCDIIKDEVEV